MGGISPVPIWDQSHASFIILGMALLQVAAGGARRVQWPDAHPGFPVSWFGEAADDC